MAAITNKKSMEDCIYIAVMPRVHDGQQILMYSNEENPVTGKPLKPENAEFPVQKVFIKFGDTNDDEYSRTYQTHNPAVEFQANPVSLTGYYLNPGQDITDGVLNKNLYDVAAEDKKKSPFLTASDGSDWYILYISTEEQLTNLKKLVENFKNGQYKLGTNVKVKPLSLFSDQGETQEWTKQMAERRKVYFTEINDMAKLLEGTQNPPKAVPNTM